MSNKNKYKASNEISLFYIKSTIDASETMLLEYKHQVCSPTWTLSNKDRHEVV